MEISKTARWPLIPYRTKTRMSEGQKKLAQGAADSSPNASI